MCVVTNVEMLFTDFGILALSEPFRGKKKKVKLSLYQAMEAHRVVKR
jgi:hypothetical protein